ncbi:MAG: hypothetical protein M3Q63_01225 [bacterium]|nr:hypothetical protein [bacterium]
MRRYIKHLRTKPDHTKKQIAFGVSSVALIGIMTIWVATFSIRFPGLVLDKEKKDADPKSQTASASSAANTLEKIKRQMEADMRKGVSNEPLDSNGVMISDPNAEQQYQYAASSSADIN